MSPPLQVMSWELHITFICLIGQNLVMSTCSSKGGCGMGSFKWVVILLVANRNCVTKKMVIYARS